MNNHNSFIMICQFIAQQRRTVRGTVINNKDLYILIRLCCNRIDRLAQIFLAIIYWNNYCNTTFSLQFSLSPLTNNQLCSLLPEYSYHLPRYVHLVVIKCQICQHREHLEKSRGQLCEHVVYLPRKKHTGRKETCVDRQAADKDA